MNSIRKLSVIGAGTTAIFAVMAFVVAPAVLAHESNGVRGEDISEQPAAATPSPACLAALQAIATARKDDRSEDASERLTADQDVSEDRLEKAAMKDLWVKARSACGHQPKPSETSAAATPACADAKTALKNALAQERAHEMSEKGTIAEHSAADLQEDQAEFAAIKALWKKAVAACGFSFKHFGHFEHSR